MDFVFFFIGLGVVAAALFFIKQSASDSDE